MRLVDVGLAALIACPPTISAGAALGAAALASMGVMAAVKKGKKKLWHDWNKSVLFVPHEDAVTHALKTLKGADRKRAESEAIVKGPARAQVFAVMVPGKPTRTA